jgi:hypothetical protein
MEPRFVSLDGSFALSPSGGGTGDLLLPSLRTERRGQRAGDADIRHAGKGERTVIRKLKSGEYRLYSRKKDAKTGKRKNLGTFRTLKAAQQHEREIQFFKRRG